MQTAHLQLWNAVLLQPNSATQPLSYLLHEMNALPYVQ
jgi:hypothetical protein